MNVKKMNNDAKNQGKYSRKIGFFYEKKFIRVQPN